MTKKPASLGASLIATKGQAVPSAVTEEKPEQTQVKAPAEGKRTAITVKLLEKPYQRMKIYGVSNRITNQDILEAALIEFLDSRGA